MHSMKFGPTFGRFALAPILRAGLGADLLALCRGNLC